MQKFILEEAGNHVPESDRQAFIDDALEDLKLMDESRLVGLGVTLEDLIEWLQSYRKDTG